MARQTLAEWAKARGLKPCGFCTFLDPKPINPGVHYCYRFAVWRGPKETPACGRFQPTKEYQDA